MSWPALLEWSGKLDTSMHHTVVQSHLSAECCHVFCGVTTVVIEFEGRESEVLQSGSPHELPQSAVVVFSFRVEFLDSGPQVTPSREILSEELIVELPTV
ncbi:hypothetical protein BHE74_00028846 [Ensete ventricosum]|nr:hypothetical protein BHE74_00028846 [Ensete ventricosum]